MNYKKKKAPQYPMQTSITEKIEKMLGAVALEEHNRDAQYVKQHSAKNKRDRSKEEQSELDRRLKAGLDRQYLAKHLHTRRVLDRQDEVC